MDKFPGLVDCMCDYDRTDNGDHAAEQSQGQHANARLLGWFVLGQIYFH
jgi:hypothetical protein